jgi:hypothetical protein
MLKSVINTSVEINGVYEQQSKLERVDLKERLQKLIKTARENLTFKEIDRMFPCEPGGDPYVRDSDGKVLKGILLHQIPDFSRGWDKETKDTYFFNGVIKEVHLLDDGKLKFFERLISAKHSDEESISIEFRVAIEDLNLDDFHLEIIIGHLESKIINNAIQESSKWRKKAVV